MLAEPVVDDADVVLVARERLEAACVGLLPVDIEAPALHLREQVARQQVVVGIVFDQ